MKTEPVFKAAMAAAVAPAKAVPVVHAIQVGRLPRRLPP